MLTLLWATISPAPPRLPVYALPPRLVFPRHYNVLDQLSRETWVVTTINLRAARAIRRNYTSNLRRTR